MEAGKLRNRVDIQEKGTGTGPTGQPVSTWITVFPRIAASVRHVSGMEAIRQGIESTQVNTSIRIRYRTGVTAGMRVKHGENVYDIEAVMPDVERRDHLDLSCKTGANDG